MLKKILITGAAGQLGNSVLSQLNGKYESSHFYIDPIFKEKSIPFFNLREFMIKLSEGEQKELFHLQDGHPSDQGARFIANFILENVVE
jgi:hypothetical protein